MPNVREAHIEDINRIADYWLLSDRQHLHDMGVDISKIPSRSEFRAMLTNQMSLPIEERNAYCLIWEIDGVPCGHSNTNPTKFGDEAFFHAHIWDANHRRSGHGLTLLDESIKTFFEKLKLKKLIGEPYALNPAPNRLLEKLGFTFIKKYRTIPGSILFEQEVNRYEMLSETFYKNK